MYYIIVISGMGSAEFHYIGLQQFQPLRIIGKMSACLREISYRSRNGYIRFGGQ